jgi:hypothetical protein
MNTVRYNNLIMFVMVLIGLMIIFSYGVGNVSAAPGGTIYVNGSSGNDLWDGYSSKWLSGTNGPKATIKNATTMVKSGGTVRIAKGTYYEHNINIEKNLNIIGENQQDTIINGANTAQIGQIFFIKSGVNVTIINLSFTKGITAFGGGIYNQGNLTLKNITCMNNTINGNGKTGISSGGTIYNDLCGNLTIKDCTFTNNSLNNPISSLGGAIINYGTLNVSNSVFINNIAIGATCGGGGAICNMVGNLTVAKCKFTNNKATTGTNGNDSGGGAIYNAQGIVVITDSNFNYNTVSGTYGHDNGGGAIANYYYGSLSVNNSTFTNNKAVGANFYGGAIFNSYFATSRIHFNRFYGNLGFNGSAINCFSGSVNAENNWWGDNKGFVGKINGFKVSKWLMLTLKAVPSAVQTNSDSKIIADLRYDNVGTLHTEGYIPNGILVNFTTTLGSIGSPSSTINGIVQSYIKSGTLGTATIIAKLDNQTLKNSVKIIDTITPKVLLTNPTNWKTGFSKTATITIKFSEYLKTSTYYNHITIKNLNTGKYVTITKSISRNTIYLKMVLTRFAYNWYQITIPKDAIKDYAGNNLSATYTFRFKTGA